MPETRSGSKSEIGSLMSYANGSIGESADGPIARVFNIVDTVLYMQADYETPSLLGRFLSRIYCQKHDLPVLGMLPLTRSRILWGQGDTFDGAVSISRDELFEMTELIYSRLPMDVTWSLMVPYELANYELDRVLSEVASWKERDERIKAALSKSQMFNHRQRSMLARAIANPEAEFSIRFHQYNHDIAYATARADSLSLEKAGYFVKHRRGKLFVFKAADGISAMM